MRSDLLDYDLPPELIAQEPLAQRDQSRLMVLRRSDGSLHHHVFADLPELLNPGDLLVLNDTRVLQARLLGRRASTGGKWEGLFVRWRPDGAWEMMCQTRGRPEIDEVIEVEPGPLRLMIQGWTMERYWVVRPNLEGLPGELLSRHGRVPLPPYIRKGRAVEGDRERYQTIYASRGGAVAAPTAGLHFTPELFERLERRGVGRVFVTLHVGPGTFQPIQEDDVTKHRMHGEWGEVSAATVEAITECRRRGNRVVAVGTTSVRVLETAAAGGEPRPWSGETELFIRPPYRFRAVDALVTNFHLPRSTLLLLVGAFAGVEAIRTAYRTAVERNYRFYSYGDAMLIE